jgi:hypothetical protein
MKYWIALLSIVVILLLGFIYFVTVEPFTSARRGQFIQIQRTIPPASESVYINKGLPIQPINSALNTPDGEVVNYGARFQEDPLIKFRAKDEATCRLARHPRQLKRALGAKFGCGWWFVPDGLSVGTLGSRAGPADRSVPTKNPTGQWIWNLDDAARMEDIKNCKRITICEATTSECGWCESQGYAVPVNPNGSLMYPADETGSCSTTPYRAGSCPAPPAPAPTPIFDSSGNVIGETAPRAPVSFCTPVNGKLSRFCLSVLAWSRGCTQRGSLYTMLNRGTPPTESDRVAIDILSKSGVVRLTSDLLGGGNVSLSTALAAYGALSNAMVSGRTKQVQQAARYLAVGGEEVNLCEIEPDSLGPFTPTCLGRAFREAGCQASGAAYPRNSSAAAGMPWGRVKQSYRDLASQMKSGDAFVQANAVRNCLGTSLNIFG